MDPLPNTYFIAVFSLSIGNYCFIDEKPCEILQISTNFLGKRRIIGKNLLSGELIKEVFPQNSQILAPKVSFCRYLLLNLSPDGYLSLLSPQNTVKDDLKIPKTDLGRSLSALFSAGKDVIVTVRTISDREKVISVQERPENYE